MPILTKSRAITSSILNESKRETPDAQLHMLTNIHVKFHDSRSNTAHKILQPTDRPEDDSNIPPSNFVCGGIKKAKIGKKGPKFRHLTLNFEFIKESR